MQGLESPDKAAADSVLVPVDRSRLVRLTNLVITATVAALSLLKWLILGSEFPPIPGMVITLLGISNGIYLALGGSSRVAARLLIGVLILGLIFGSFNTGGFGGPVVLLAPVIPVLSFLLIGARAGWWSAIAMVLGLLVVVALHLLDAVPASPQAGQSLIVGRFIALAASGLIVTWVLWAFATTAAALGLRNEVLANTDHLTGIANRRFLENYLNQEVLRARRSGKELSLIVSDVDFFKRYNDVNGHQAGDECLQRVAAVMDNAVRRPADMVGRLGGEEFMVVLPDTGPDGAFTLAESMRQALLEERMPYEPGDSDWVSMTLGVTTLRGSKVESGSTMIRLADRALYKGKAQGRNRVVMNLPSLDKDHTVPA